MPKRTRSDADYQKPFKRSKFTSAHELYDLSDELLLHILSYLSAADLVVTARVSPRLKALSDDSEVWKQKYYERWVLPRALRMPRARKSFSEERNAPCSWKRAPWLSERHLRCPGNNTDWKRQYRIRYNWWRGNYRLRGLELEQPSAPAVLVQSHRGFIFTADSSHRLLAWSLEMQSEPLALLNNPTLGSPTVLKIDATVQDSTRLAVAYESGTFVIVDFHEGSGFKEISSSVNFDGKAIAALAIACPYILIMTLDRSLNLYRSQTLTELTTTTDMSNDLLLLSSLQSESVYAPTAISLRKHVHGVTASIAYSFTGLNNSWHIGLQELRLSRNGELLDSRSVSTLDSQSGLCLPAHSSRALASFLQQPTPRPTSLSYSHPYLLATLPNNTLRVHLVTSNLQKLHIGVGQTLWGHTSGVSGAEINDRGKAISVSTRGDDIRVWELEEAMASKGVKRTNTRPSCSLKAALIARAIPLRYPGVGLAVNELREELTFRRSLIGFDDEQVLVLQVPVDECGSRQILSCYDFT